MAFPAAIHHHKPHLCHADKTCIIRVAADACARQPTDKWHCAIMERHLAHVTAVIASAAAPPAPAPVAVPGSATTALSWCVAGLEGGHNFSINTGNGFYGTYQFDAGTWQAVEQAMGVSWAPTANLATPAEQTAAFNFWEPNHRLAWPATVPACGG